MRFCSPKDNYTYHVIEKAFETTAASFPSLTALPYTRSKAFWLLEQVHKQR